jgi:hypothetical protein
MALGRSWTYRHEIGGPEYICLVWAIAVKWHGLIPLFFWHFHNIHLTSQLQSLKKSVPSIVAAIILLIGVTANRYYI